MSAQGLAQRRWKTSASGFANTYFDMSQGPGEVRGSWNQGEQWDYVSDRDKQVAVDGGPGDADVKLSDHDMDVLKAMALRTESDPAVNPATGAELGMGNQTLAQGQTVGGNDWRGNTSHGSVQRH